MCIYIYTYFSMFKVIQSKLDEQIRPFTLLFRCVSLYIYIYDLETCGDPNKCYNYVDNNEDGHEND